MSLQSLAGAAIMAVLVAALGCSPLAAQVDYRNLDAGRPVRTEDAYATERFEFELVLPYAYEKELGASRAHVIAPELNFGLLPNLQVGVTLPIAAYEDGTGLEWGSAGPRFFSLYNFNTESFSLPAFAVRLDAAVAAGEFAAARGAVTGIVTRSWGATRAHLNAALGIGPAPAGVMIEPIPEWATRAAIDHTFLRRSVLLVGEIAVQRFTEDTPTEVATAIGARWQWTPVFVLDAGVRRRLTRDAGPDLGVTVGVSYAFALPGLMPLGGGR